MSIADLPTPPASPFAAQDHADLAQAAGLVNGVLERHQRDAGVSLLAVGWLCQSVSDIHLGERYLGVTR